MNEPGRPHEVVQRDVGRSSPNCHDLSDLDTDTAQSNLFRVEWPPRSGRYEEVPEIDEVAWLTPTEARRRIKDTQIPFIDRLEAALVPKIEP